jgi:hypothetical protein
MEYRIHCQQPGLPQQVAREEILIVFLLRTTAQKVLYLLTKVTELV